MILARLTIARWQAPALGFCEAVAYAVLAIAYLWHFRDLVPRPVIWRVLASMATSVVILTACILTPAQLRAWMALPAASLVLLFVLLVLSDRELIQRPIVNALRGLN